MVYILYIMTTGHNNILITTSVLGIWKMQTSRNFQGTTIGFSLQFDSKAMFAMISEKFL